MLTRDLVVHLQSPPEVDCYFERAWEGANHHALNCVIRLAKDDLIEDAELFDRINSVLLGEHIAISHVSLHHLGLRSQHAK